MYASKLAAGSIFPRVTVQKLQGGILELSEKSSDYDWRLVVVYRGKHCPLCTRYLTALNFIAPQLHEIGVDVVAVSADTEEKAIAQMEIVKPEYPIGYGLTIEQMQSLGLYISDPRSPQETDRPFAEPGIFVINENGKIQVTDISNGPFARPELTTLVSGLGFIKDPNNNYPIRGTHSIGSD